MKERSAHTSHNATQGKFLPDELAIYRLTRFKKHRSQRQEAISLDNACQHSHAMMTVAGVMTCRARRFSLDSHDRLPTENTRCHRRLRQLRDPAQSTCRQHDLLSGQT
ncbi:hypothetical protein C1X61_09870 [Pseudomonas sp. FW215-T2]|nr:hypothetical protein C1X61_09870 [Pseudomonas sp. FW215-T2]PNA15711.1 hypothetical protein C1X62_03440 [Pseudomonas sp. FW215-R3]PNB37738.1 hypothetical protein C1X63_11140 [Pseudomonas sp. FW305-131]